MGKFEKDLLVGKLGEVVARKLLLESPSTKGFVDVSKDEYYQEKDIDFIVERNDGRVIKYEVKTDTQAHETGNIVYELTTSGNEGCLKKSEADYIIYYLSETKEVFGFWLEQVRDYIEKNHDSFRKCRMGDYATGYLIPIDGLKSFGLINKLN